MVKKTTKKKRTKTKMLAEMPITAVVWGQETD